MPLSPRAKRPAAKPSPETDRDELSALARKMLEDGLESAKRSEVRPWEDFTKYVDDEK